MDSVLEWSDTMAPEINEATPEPAPVVVAMTPKKFEEAIEDIVWELDVTHFDAVLEYCKRNQLEPDEIARLVNKNLREKLQVDAISEGYLPKPAQLPI